MDFHIFFQGDRILRIIVFTLKQLNQIQFFRLLKGHGLDCIEFTYSCDHECAFSYRWRILIFGILAYS